MKLLLPFLALFSWIVPASGEGLTGKVMCGYQGWFRTAGDGSQNGWHHYTNGKNFAPGSCSIDLWPDVREFPAEARVATGFRHADGSVAEVFSSTHPAVIAKHFEWMKAYGIDGVFLQRFAVSTKDPRFRMPMDGILAACRKSAGETGRSWSLMYDLSGLKPGEAEVVISDWKRLQNDLNLTAAKASPTYLRHRGKPLVALWGLGFSDRAPMLDDWRQLIRFFKEEAGCSLMLGVPTYWRTLERDAIADPALLELIVQADVVSPWTVGRYRTTEDVRRHADRTMKEDLAWCRERKLDFLPVAFPGFSWHNLSAARGRTTPVNEIPRDGGKFFWSQADRFRHAGASALYVAMFDELDEGTAIFKVRQDPPVGASPFVAETDVPGDQYLWLTGQAGRLMRGELPGDGPMPVRPR